MGFTWLWPNRDTALSPDEATELAARVAELTRAGLPLGPGLRAMAEELPERRFAGVLTDIANRLDAGVDLIAAIDSLGAQFPDHLRGLMSAGVRSGRLVDVLDQYDDLQRSQSELRRRVWMTLGYPFVLLLFVTLLSVLASEFLVDSFAKIFRDFGTALPAMTLFVIYGTRPIMWFLVVLCTVAVIGPMILRFTPKAGWLWSLLYRVPTIGPLFRWSHLSRFSRLMGILLMQNVPMPDALRNAASGVGNPRLARGCRSVADDTEKGRPLDESLAAWPQFPTTLVAMVQWGLRTTALPDAFHAAAEMYEGRVRLQGTLLEALLLPIMCLTILIFIGFFVIAMFMPLICLITKLSG